MKKTFEEVVLFARTGLNPRQNFKLGQGNNNYITIKNIKNNSLVIDDNTDVVDDEAIKLIHKRSQIKKGDVLFASIGRMGDMFIIEEEPIGWDINESVFAFTLNTNIVKQKYFYYIFRVKSTLDYLISNSSGSTFKSIKMNQLKKMVFDIPQLEEQDYIISVLDKVCDVIEKRKQELEFLDNLIKARFVEMFGSCKKKCRLSDYAELITKGASPRWQGIEYSDKEEGTLFITSENVRERFVDYTKKKYLPNEINSILPRSVLKRNDVLINIVNASIGRAAIYERDDLANINQAVALIRLKPDVLNLQFLLAFLNSDEAIRAYDYMKVGGDKSNLSLKNISDLQIPIVGMDLQNQFAYYVHKVDKSKFMKSF